MKAYYSIQRFNHFVFVSFNVQYMYTASLANATLSFLNTVEDRNSHANIYIYIYIYIYILLLAHFIKNIEKTTLHYNPTHITLQCVQET